MIENEKRELLDENENLTGEYIYVGEDIPKDRYVRAVRIFIENSEGKFLIQKRSKNRDDKYGTTGGHPKMGEGSLDGMITEVKEELGLSIKEDDIVLATKVRWNNDINDIYYMKKDIKDLKELRLQKEEVDDVYWFSADEIEDINKRGEMLESHYYFFKKFIEWKEKNGK